MFDFLLRSSAINSLLIGNCFLGFNIISPFKGLPHPPSAPSPTTGEGLQTDFSAPKLNFSLACF